MLGHDRASFGGFNAQSQQFVKDIWRCWGDDGSNILQQSGLEEWPLSVAALTDRPINAWAEAIFLWRENVRRLLSNFAVAEDSAEPKALAARLMLESSGELAGCHKGMRNTWVGSNACALELLGTRGRVPRQSELIALKGEAIRSRHIAGQGLHCRGLFSRNNCFPPPPGKTRYRRPALQLLGVCSPERNKMKRGECAPAVAATGHSRCK